MAYQELAASHLNLMRQLKEAKMVQKKAVQDFLGQISAIVKEYREAWPEDCPLDFTWQDTDRFEITFLGRTLLFYPEIQRGPKSYDLVIKLRVLQNEERKIAVYEADKKSWRVYTDGGAISFEKFPDICVKILDSFITWAIDQEKQVYGPGAIAPGVK